MADEVKYDWSKVSGQAVERLRAPKVHDVPSRIVELAQESWNGRPLTKDGKPVLDKDGQPVLMHNMRHDFGAGQEARAKAFAEHMRHAGDHTTPLTSISVVIDPDGTGAEHVVAWKAGNRRGRQTTV